ncbi:MAG: hypothetical protein IKU60_02040 [Clostridia bacterium]|nr:hypothetical protein [Clostridia bacterium]
MKHKIYIHPFTIPLFVLAGMTNYGCRFYILYLFILLHEISHMTAGLILKEKVSAIKLMPWGCILCLSSIPKRKSTILIALAGPVFNLVMFYMGIFPPENLSLALFNLIPVLPLDGGVIINALFTKGAFFISSAFIVIICILCIYFRLPLYLPIILAVLLITGEKNRMDRNLSAKIIGYFKKES